LVAVKPRQRPAPDDVAFTNAYRDLHKRHGLSWVNGLAGAALGVAVGTDTVYVNGEDESPDAKEVERVIID
jgi:hypothetical protein